MKKLFLMILCAFWLSVNFMMAESVENMSNFNQNSNFNIKNQKCENNDAKMCIEIAQEFYGDDKQIRKKYMQQAYDIYDSKCKDGDNIACLDSAYVNVVENVGDDTNAFERAKQNCNERESRGCFIMGIFYRKGKIVAKDSEKALELYERACHKASIGRACFYSWFVYFYKACELGNNEACYLYGKANENNNTPNNAIKIACENGYKKACNVNHIKFFENDKADTKILDLNKDKNQCNVEKNSNACFNVAKAYMRQGCNNDEICFYNTGKIYEGEERYISAFDAYKKACELKYKVACDKINDYVVIDNKFKLN
ncbi:hypothetical protein OFN97_00190 [Campylobacter sp. VBCF_05 NA6]|uniref:hypothetical protein n=1 Tax=unclassified Campylobacter TaxID=2593542 RepID=UPI0022EA06E5|nr:MULTISPECIES: hypothetical protein [unclassified Campylobacter]MDA3057540.1 hypothetical protein [Campylobacter sp. VBCF_04 NA7]MDA3058440.1 hypothetical protein [Campylobacter sp. VBCF_05 NA6]